MPNRILREGILTSERVDGLSLGGEVFYRRLMSAVDDFGRFWGNPSLLLSYLYPLRVDRVKVKEVELWLSESVKAGLVNAYEVGGKRYVEVVDFRQQVRSNRSRFPDKCESDAKQVLSKCDQMITLFGDGDVDGDDLEVLRTSAQTGEAPDHELAVKSPVKRIVFDWNKYEWDGIEESDIETWQEAYPACAIRNSLNQMAEWLKSNPGKGKKSNYYRFIVNWLKREQDRGGNRL